MTSLPFGSPVQNGPGFAQSLQSAILSCVARSRRCRSWICLPISMQQLPLLSFATIPSGSFHNCELMVGYRVHDTISFRPFRSELLPIFWGVLEHCITVAPNTKRRLPSCKEHLLRGRYLYPRSCKGFQAIELDLYENDLHASCDCCAQQGRPCRSAQLC